MQRDFRLPAGKVSSKPEELSVTLAADSSTVKTLTLANKGGKDTSARLSQTGSGTNKAAPWLSLSPETGAVPKGGNLKVTATFNASGMQPGTYTAQIMVTAMTPYPSPTIPVTMVVKAKNK